MPWTLSSLRLRHNPQNRVSLKSSISSPRPVMESANLSTVPEEIRQQIISYLDYQSAWALKQTSTLFYQVSERSLMSTWVFHLSDSKILYLWSRSNSLLDLWSVNTDSLKPIQVIEIPTIATFLANPNGTALATLEKENIFPTGREGREACYYCRRLLRSNEFSRLQQGITAARQKEGSYYDYESYKPEKHFCVNCGFKDHLYPLGQPIYVTGWYKSSFVRHVIACQYCSEIIDFDLVACESCRGCYTCIDIARKAVEDDMPIAFTGDERCNHKAIIDTCKAFKRFGFGCSEEIPLLEINGQPPSEPDCYDYVEKDYELLALVGEKRIKDSQYERRHIYLGKLTPGLHAGFNNWVVGGFLECW